MYYFAHTLTKYKTLFTLVAAVVLSLFVFAPIVSAADVDGGNVDDGTIAKDAIGCKATVDCVPGMGLVCTGGTCVVQDFGVGTNGFGTELGLGDRQLDDAVIGVINLLLGFLGLIAVIIILIAGFRWMTAGSNEEKHQQARAGIVSGVIGIVIILSAWAIAQFVIQQGAIATESGDYTNFIN